MTIARKSKSLAIYKKISDIFINDEQLMRLLVYKPEDENSKRYIPDPLDPSLENIIGSEDYWDYVDDRVVLGEKTSDLVEKDICRIYIYEGRRRPVFDSYIVANQEFCVDVFIHETYDKDMRISRINDRINELISIQRVVGMGKVEYKAGNPREAPTHYRRYLNLFSTLVGKK